VQDLIKPGGRKMEITASDSFTVVMKIASRYALMTSAVGSVRIMPKHVLEAAFRKGEFASAYSTSTPPAQLVTSGPWRLEENVPGEKTVLARNPYWFGVDTEGRRLPYLSELVYLIVPDQNTADLKFRSGEVDGLDNVKPENYQWYEDNQAQGNYTLYDLGPSLNSTMFWFNLNRVREAKEGRRAGEPAVGAVKFAWFNNPVFRRAVSMAVDRDAMIKSVYFGDAVKNWSSSTPGNKIWSSPDIVHYDYDPEQAKKLIASLGWKDTNGDGFVEDQKGNTVSFTMKTNSDNVIRVQLMNFVRDDLAKIGVKVIPAPADFNTLVTNIREDFDYESMLLGLSSSVPPDPGMGQNVWRSSGNTHYWDVRQPKPDTPGEAQINLLMDQLIGTNDLGERKRYWTDIENIVNDQGWFEWLPTQVLKVPVRNRFGNMRPSVMPHRILWCIDQAYVKHPGSAA
jgi:peptide/nickel transport system substrate-binding protein